MFGSSIEDKKFSLPDDIINHLKNIVNNNQNNKTSDGYKRLNFLIDNSSNINYNEMKRLKNFFDNYKGIKNDSIYTLNGGDVLKNWVNFNLEANRVNSKSSKETHSNAGINNAFAKEHTKDVLNANPTKVSLPDVNSLYKGTVYSESFQRFVNRFNEINEKFEK